MKALVLLSGGMDSGTCLAEAISMERAVEALSINYGSKHGEWELEAARKIAKHYCVRHTTLDVRHSFAVMESALLKSNKEKIPEGHYQEENMRQTVVPGRNLMFISYAMALAISHEASEIWLGVHSGDHFIYPDCRPEFIEAAKKAVMVGSDFKVTIMTPFLTGDKTSILRSGLDLDFPYRLTRTCYKDQKIACGVCGSCQERLEAFRHCTVDDPLEYETRAALPRT